MTRVLYVVFSGYWGGAEEYVARMAERLPGGFEPVIGVAEAGVRARMTRRVPAASVLAIDVPNVGAPARCLAYRRTVAQVRPALVHVNLPSTYEPGAGPAAVLARLSGARVVTTEHLASVPRSRRRTAARRIWDRSLARVITVCEANRAALVERGVSPRRIAVIHNGTPIGPTVPDAASRGTTRASLGVSDDDVLVLAVGAVDARKRPEALVRAATEAARSAPHLRVALVGDGALRARIEAIVAANGAPVRVLGPRPDVPQLLDACDATVSLSEREGLPFAILEAMAAGRPVVATAVDGVPEAVVDDVCGILVPPRDDAAVVRALVRVATDPAARARWGAAGAARARERFDVDRMARDTVDVYRAVLESR